MPASPSTDNYYIGKAVISWQANSVGAFRDVGNVPECEFTMDVQKLDHFSSRTGVRSKDKSVVIEKAATVRLVLEEMTVDNMALAMGGTVYTDSDGNKSFGFMADNAKEGTLKILGTNEIGQKVNWIGQVSFAPTGSFNPISEEWGSVEATGEILVDAAGNFGVFTVLEQASS
jgi:hypothetical protein